jgi:hypothetical protein
MDQARDRVAKASADQHGQERVLRSLLADSLGSFAVVALRLRVPISRLPDVALACVVGPRAAAVALSGRLLPESLA